MKHLLLDINIILDMWLERGEYWLIDKLLAEKTAVKFWCVAGSLSIIEYIFIRELKKEGAATQKARALSKKMFALLFTRVQVLSNLGFEQAFAVENGHDLEDAQIALALSSLHGEKRIVTNDFQFDTLGLVDSCTPGEALAWIRTDPDIPGSDQAVNFIDLKTQQDTIRPALEEKFHKVLRHGRYILGPEVQELEEKLADFVGVRHSIGVSSGTDALLIALMSKGIGPGDAIFTTPFTFIATAEVVSLLGATPVFVDIDPLTFNIDPDQLQKAIAALSAHDPSVYPLPANHHELTGKAVIPVDLFGLPADYDPIMNLAQEHGFFVLEDAAQGLGGVYKGRQAGSLGHAAAASFFPAKPLGCYGDGGALLTDNDELAEQARSIRVHGKGDHKYDNVRIGLNARLHTLQAAILLPKLEIFPQEIEQRQRVAQRYSDGLSGLNNITVPSVPDGLQSVWAQYSLLSKDRDKIQKHLKDNNIPTVVYYGRPLHLQPAYENLAYCQGDMPVSEQVSAQIFSLPMHPYLSDDDIALIVKELKRTS